MRSYIKKIIPEKESRYWFFLVVIILLLWYPYLLAGAYLPFIESNIQSQFAITLLLIGVVALFIKKIYLPGPIVLIVLVMVLGCLASYWMTGHKYYYHKLIIMTGSLMLIQIVYLKVGFVRFYTLYNKWIFLMAILGVVGFVVAFAGVPPVSTFIVSENGNPISSWIITFSKQLSPGPGFIRYAGFFDEPGAMGYWGTFALAINRLFIKDLKLEKWLIVCLLFTFSMGFISQIAIFFALLLLGPTTKFKTKFLWAITAIVVIVGVYSTKGGEYDAVYQATIGRFEDASKGEDFLDGTSRERLTRDTKEVFEKHPWFGIGWPEKDERYLGDNPYETLAHDGIFGTVYLYFPFILLFYWSIKRRDYELFAMTLYMVAGFMHRPFHFNFLTFFIFYSIPLMYYNKMCQERLKYGTL